MIKTMLIFQQGLLRSKTLDSLDTEQVKQLVKRGSNFIPLVLDTRLLMVVNGKARDKEQLNATYIMGLLVEHCKNDLEPEAYEELKKRYSKTVYQQKREKLAKEKAKIEREKKKLSLRAKELKLQEQRTKAYGQAMNLGVAKRKEKELESLYEDKESLDYSIEQQKSFRDNDKTNHLFDQTKLNEYEKELAQVRKQLEQLEKR